jgi:hypothetical protein
MVLWKITQSDINVFIIIKFYDRIVILNSTIFRVIIGKVVINGKNTEGVNKRTEADLKEISSDIWQKLVKIGKNTEGVNKQTETDFKEISGDIWQKLVKIGKNTEGVKPYVIKKINL